MEEPARTIIKTAAAKSARQENKRSMSKAARAIISVLQVHNDSLAAQNIALQAHGEAIANLEKSLALLNTVLIEITQELKDLGDEGDEENPKIGGTDGP